MITKTVLVNQKFVPFPISCRLNRQIRSGVAVARCRPSGVIAMSMMFGLPLLYCFVSVSSLLAYS